MLLWLTCLGSGLFADSLACSQLHIEVEIGSKEDKVLLRLHPGLHIIVARHIPAICSLRRPGSKRGRKGRGVLTEMTMRKRKLRDFWTGISSSTRCSTLWTILMGLMLFCFRRCRRCCWSSNVRVDVSDAGCSPQIPLLTTCSTAVASLSKQLGAPAPLSAPILCPAVQIT